MLNICICQLIKDEQRYIEEWIEYYLDLGIKKFILFEDWNSSSHKNVLKKYGNKVILHKLLDILNDDEKQLITGNQLRQIAVWKCFYRLYKDKFDCCLFIDPDEFIKYDTKENFYKELEEYASKEKYPNVKFVKYMWQIMTSNGYINDPYPNQKYSVLKTYKYPLIEDYQEYINRCNYQLQNNLEIDDYNLNTKNLIYLYKLNSDDEFKDIPHNAFLITNYVLSNYKLQHFVLKSFEEYKYKLFNKGEQINKYFSRKIDFFFKINKDLTQYKNICIKSCKNFIYKYNIY